MEPAAIQTIDNILLRLDDVILECAHKEDPLGYFAVLYRRVTQKIKEGIQQQQFDDNPRMERLDIVFANRYLDAYRAYRAQEPHTESWAKAFGMSKKFWPIVLQHLLIGINAHINLDLGIAAAEVSKGRDVQDLYSDFCKVNAVLSALVNETQNNLSAIWPFLKWILGKSGDLDNYLVDFSMQVAREGAWQFAQSLAAKPENEWADCIRERDLRVAGVTHLITEPHFGIRFALGFVRLGELGAVSGKIQKLRGQILSNTESISPKEPNSFNT